MMKFDRKLGWVFQQPVKQAVNPVNYGNNTKTIDTTALQDGINSGKVQGTEIIPPAQVRENLQARIEEKQTAFDKNPSDDNLKSLNKAKGDLSNATRDGECLIRGCIPAPYIRPVYPQGTTPIRPPILLPSNSLPVHKDEGK
jgi:filamentous hemagglutinin